MIQEAHFFSINLPLSNCKKNPYLSAKVQEERDAKFKSKKETNAGNDEPRAPR